MNELGAALEQLRDFGLLGKVSRLSVGEVTVELLLEPAPTASPISIQERLDALAAASSARPKHVTDEQAEAADFEDTLFASAGG